MASIQRTDNCPVQIKLFRQFPLCPESDSARKSVDFPINYNGFVLSIIIIIYGKLNRVRGVPEKRSDIKPVVGIFSQIKFRLRSEEHTSELQSRENLVCRLLLEKKKTET